MIPLGHMFKLGTALAVALSLSVLIGCSSVATNKGFYEPITAEIQSGRYDTAAVQVEKARADGKWSEKDRLLYFIDAGLVYHYARQYEVSNTELHDADQALEELYAKSVSRAAASLFLNDNVLEYSGEDYESIYVNLISALNYLALNDFENGFVETRRVNEKLDLLEQKYTEMARELRVASQKDTSTASIEFDDPKPKFFNDAFARYLSMHMYAAEGSYYDARVDHDLLIDAFESQPHIYDFSPPEVIYDSGDEAIVSVVALDGLAPTKEALSLRLRTDKQLDLVQIIYDDPGMQGAEYSHIPFPVDHDYYFKFAIPKLIPRPSSVVQVVIYADSVLVGQAELLEDVSKVAMVTYETKKTIVFIKTLLRAIVKGLANYRAKKKADSGGLGGWLKKAAIDIASDLLENPDLRSAQFLPGKVRVKDFAIKPGFHDFRIEFLDGAGEIVSVFESKGIEIKRGKFNLIEAFTQL